MIEFKMTECILVEVIDCYKPGDKIKKYVGEKHYVPLERLNEIYDEENPMKEVNLRYL